MKYTFYATHYIEEHFYLGFKCSQFDYYTQGKHNPDYKMRTTCKIVKIFSGNNLNELRKEIGHYSNSLSMGNGITIHTL